MRTDVKDQTEFLENQLLSGPIVSSLVRLALPITATAFVQMTYSLVDMFWIGRIGTEAIAAVGAGGMMLWLSEGLLLFSRVGGQVFTATNIGANNRDSARRYAAASLELAIILASTFALLMISFRTQLIGFFNFNNAQTIALAKDYLTITSIGVIFAFWANTLSSLSIAAGDSKTPFMINSLGLILNIIFDPLLIFKFNLGVAGAGLATAGAQLLVATGLSITVLRRAVFSRLPFNRHNPRLSEYRQLLRFGAAPAIESMGFTVISIILSRLVAGFGEVAFAVQRVGTQIEAVSWRTGDGFANSIRAFISQNYGASKLERALRGQRIVTRIMVSFGIVNGFLLFFLAGPLFSLFSNDVAVIEGGVHYLRILAWSQAFMCLEIIMAGSFNGFGESAIPSSTTLFLTSLRIPAAYLLTPYWGIDGVWLAITGSSILKGIALNLLYRNFCKRRIYPKLTRQSL